MACILESFGFSHISMSRIRVVESSIIPSPGQAARAIGAIIRVIEGLLTRFKRPIAIIAVLAKLLKVIEDLKTLVENLEGDDNPDQKRVDEVKNKLLCNCKPKPGVIYGR